ncbi:hypothetical protein Nepgr_010399 [Nepenthes gracilis]|uniref:Reverse transcriptase/retrotransposon-derived protein RNase H-like domain-containing protein n=1 Tax=Nepenthes gracilis TaxID=150966 RepID=A0AAD3SCV0_NEPGR|nr:hypothetical protein Nepgr_010399 [Nepenthes gracilis]
MVHKFDLNSGHKPMRQKHRNHSVKKLIAIRKEVKRLLDARFIREVQHPNWVADNHIRDLEEAFQILQAHRMKLNPAKYTFGVTSGKFLGFIVFHHGIETNPEKIKTILDMNPSRMVKEVQKFTGRPAALSQFFVRSAEKYLPFFNALRGTKPSGFRRTKEYDGAFKELKTYLTNPPLLNSPCTGKDLYLYLATSGTALNSVLVREHEGAQRPVYYVSQVLTDVEACYP